MQYKVPQNVDMEDRVIGSLSLRQFVILLIGIGAAILVYLIMPKPLKPFAFMIDMVVLAIAATIAFYRYGDQNFETFLSGAIKTFSTPRYRVWKKYEEIPQTVKAAPPKEKDIQKIDKKSLEEAKNDLQRLAELVDSGGYVNIENKDRSISSQEIKTDEDYAMDLIENTETDNQRIDGDIEKAKKQAPKREPLLSEVAKVSPSKKFEYPEIKIRDFD